MCDVVGVLLIVAFVVVVVFGAYAIAGTFKDDKGWP